MSNMQQLTPPPTPNHNALRPLLSFHSVTYFSSVPSMSNYVIWLQFTHFHKPPSQQLHDLFPKPSSNVQAAVYTVYSNTPTDPSRVVQVQPYDTELVTYIQTVSRRIRLRGSFWRTTEGAEICRG